MCCSWLGSAAPGVVVVVVGVGRASPAVVGRDPREGKATKAQPNPEGGILASSCRRATDEKTHPRRLRGGRSGEGGRRREKAMYHKNGKLEHGDTSIKVKPPDAQS